MNKQAHEVEKPSQNASKFTLLTLARQIRDTMPSSIELSIMKRIRTILKAGFYFIRLVRQFSFAFMEIFYRQMRIGAHNRNAMIMNSSAPDSMKKF